MRRALVTSALWERDDESHWDVKDNEIYVGCVKLTFRKNLNFDYTLSTSILNHERDFMSN
jgi:hypothetical protein